MKTILSVIVGSRLHGTHSETSDYDYRGCFIAPIEDILSPFRQVKETSWIEGDEDSTHYELRHFCKMASQGNPSALEVLVGIPKEITPEGEELRKMLPKFLSKKRCFDAFMGYSRNQEKKFREDYQGRKWKYATAHTRTLYQLLHLLKTGELVGTYPGGVVDELKLIKQGVRTEGDIMGRIFQLEGLCREAYDVAPLPDAPDQGAIESFVLSCYLSTGQTRPLSSAASVGETRLA